MTKPDRISPFCLVADKRERDILDILKTSNPFWDANERVINWRAEHLTIGDYIIFYKDIAIMVIERKTWNDLASSFHDGRKANINKLKQFNSQTGARISYLIEGQAFPSKTTKFSRIPYRNLRAHLDHLLVRDNIVELRSSGHHDTIDRMFELIRNLSTLPINELIVNKTIGGNHAANKIKKNDVNGDDVENDVNGDDVENDVNGNDAKNDVNGDDVENDTDTDDEADDADDEADTDDKKNHLALAKVQFKVNEAMVIDRLWCCIPGISVNSVKLFRSFKIGDLLTGNLTVATISKLSYGNGRVFGIKKAKKIVAISKLNNHTNLRNYIRILSAIPGISRPTALKILDAFPMVRIITDWQTIRPLLVELSRGKTRLGENLVATIEHYLIIRPK
jgi:ERCC4-type nuclease